MCGIQVQRVTVNVHWLHPAVIADVCGVQCWNAISQKMNALGWTVDSVQCDTKFKALKKKFKEVKDHNNTSGNSRRTWNFYDVSCLYPILYDVCCNICVLVLSDNCVSGGNHFACFCVVKMCMWAINAVFCTSEIAYVGIARIFAAGVSCHEDRLHMLRHTALATKCAPIRSRFHSAVTDDVSCYDAAVLRKCQPRRHPAVSAQATWVGDELHCSAGVLIVAVRPHHSTCTPAALVDGKWANSFQPHSPCLHVSTQSSSVVPCWRT